MQQDQRLHLQVRGHESNMGMTAARLHKCMEGNFTLWLHRMHVQVLALVVQLLGRFAAAWWMMVH